MCKISFCSGHRGFGGGLGRKGGGGRFTFPDGFLGDGRLTFFHQIVSFQPPASKPAFIGAGSHGCIGDESLPLSLQQKFGIQYLGSLTVSHKVAFDCGS
jgi:hypothetical protein